MHVKKNKNVFIGKNGFSFYMYSYIFFFYIFLHQFRYTTHLFTPRSRFPGRGKQFSTWPTSEPSETTDIIRFLVGSEKKIEFLLIKPLYYSFNCRVPTSRITMHFTFQETGFNKKNSLFAIRSLFPKTI